MRFEFCTAGKIYFGAGSREHLKDILTAERVFVVTGKSLARIEPLLPLLEKKRTQIDLFSVNKEPDIELIAAGLRQARARDCQAVVSIGGGSVIDAGKVIAAMLKNHGHLQDYLEVIGKGKLLESPGVPHYALPTTAGTGAEVTRNAVLASPEHQVKVSLRSPFLLPAAAIVDPELTLSLPPQQTAYSGLDAFTQLLEAFVTPFANPLTDAFCREGLRQCGRYLIKAYENGHDLVARTGMSLASLLSGLALANAKLGAIHGFAGPIGGLCEAPHGAVCATLLPWVVEMNIRLLQEEDPSHPSLRKYKEAAELCTGKSDLHGFVDWCRQLLKKMKIPPLSEFGVQPAMVGEIIERAEKASSMKGNPVKLNHDSLREILENALHTS